MQQISPPAIERLAEIQIPTLVIVGDEDALLLHQVANKLEQDLPRMTRVRIADTQHCLAWRGRRNSTESFLNFSESCNVHLMNLTRKCKTPGEAGRLAFACPIHHARNPE